MWLQERIKELNEKIPRIKKKLGIMKNSVGELIGEVIKGMIKENKDAEISWRDIIAIYNTEKSPNVSLNIDSSDTAALKLISEELRKAGKLENANEVDQHIKEVEGGRL